MSPKDTAYIVERLAVRFMSMVAEYERKLLEHRDAFGARTKADAKIIDGMRAAADEQVLSASEVASVLGCAGETPVQAAKRVVKERNGLLTQVQDQRVEIERLKSLSPKYKVGDKLEWQKLGLSPCSVTVTGIRLVYDCIGEGAEYPVGHSEDELRAIISHDTPAGKEAAESVIRDFRSGDSEVSITGLFDDTKITVRREPDQNHGSRIVISDANDMGEANIYLTESGARQMATALIGLCDVRKVPQ